MAARKVEKGVTTAELDRTTGSVGVTGKSGVVVGKTVVVDGKIGVVVGKIVVLGNVVLINVVVLGVVDVNKPAVASNPCVTPTLVVVVAATDWGVTKPGNVDGIAVIVLGTASVVAFGITGTGVTSVNASRLNC